MDDLENTATGGEGEALSFEARIEQTMSNTFDNAQAEEAPETNTGERQRDQTGRFVSNKPAESAVETAAKQDTEILGDQGDEAEEAGSEQVPATRAPASWSPAAKQAFENADPVIQAEILKREADINRHMQSTAEERKQYAPLQQVLGPRAELLAEEHGSVAEGIADLFKLSDFAAEDPVQFIQWFAQQRGVDLNRLATGQPAQSNGQNQRDPVINALQQQMQAIRSHLSAEAQNAANRQIEDFRKDRPHFDAVRHQMGQLIDAGFAEGLEDAYDQAVHMNPALRKEILSAAQKAEAERLAKEANEKAARARKASGTNVRASGAPTAVKSGPKTIEQTMGEAFDRAVGA